MLPFLIPLAKAIAPTALSWGASKLFGDSGKPYMPGIDEARSQYEWDRRAMQDSMAANRHPQTTPWGSVSWDGDHQTVALNPHDQRNLTEQRRLQTQMLRAARPMVGSMARMYQNPFKERLLHDVRMPKFQKAPAARFNVDMPQFMAAHSGGLPQVGTSMFRNLNTEGLPTPSSSQFAEVNFGGLPGVRAGQFQGLNLGGLSPMPRAFGSGFAPQRPNAPMPRGVGHGINPDFSALAQAMMGMRGR